jgi:ATP-dependent DNA helicase RecQ
MSAQGLEVIYVTPERLQRDEFMARLAEIGCSLFVIDEAHCISEWGHDFRPAYLALRHAIAALGRPPVLALTATATPSVERDIARQLDLREPLILRRSAVRPTSIWMFSTAETTPRSTNT